LTIQFIDIFYPNVFKRYSSKYNIFRDLYENDLCGIEIRGIDFKLAQKIKSIILGNKEICYNTGKKGDSFCDLLVLGSIGVFKELAKEIISSGNEDIGLRINRTIKNVTNYENQVIEIGGRKFSLNKAFTVGILNVTPDSFSDGGKYLEKDEAVKHGLEMLDDGADILDVGGESSRPGADPVTEEEEIKRVIPVIKEILNKRPGAIISVDTTKSRVAYEVLYAGAKIINDISSFDRDKDILEAVKSFNAFIILMHMKGDPKTMQNAPYYDDVVTEVYDYLTTKVEYAKKAGVNNIIIDPGVGFGKRVMDNYELLKRLREFKGIGQPIFVGLSKKSFLGKALNLGIDERENHTLIAETLAIKNGARFIRTHNVKNAAAAVKVNTFLENPELLLNV
jgi:dihydropteroate synthase